MNKYCKICKCIFEPNHGLSLYCSEKCKKLAKKLEDLRWKEKYPTKYKEINKRCSHAYHKNNPSKAKNRGLKLLERNPDYHKDYHLKNKEVRNKRAKKWAEAHKKERNFKLKQKRKTDIYFKLICVNRVRVRQVLKGITKSKTTIKLLGCSIEQLKQHLESQFKKAMTWKNWGTGWNDKGTVEWHIDHIRPCASFDLSKPSEQKKCFYYTNLQPLWAKENLRKGDKYEN